MKASSRLIFGCLIWVGVACVVGCGTEQVYLEQEATLPECYEADLDRFVFIVDVETIHDDQSVDLFTYNVGCLDGEKLRGQRFTLRPGEWFDTRYQQRIQLVSVDLEGRTAKLRGSEVGLVERGLLPRKQHALEKPMPPDRMP